MCIIYHTHTSFISKYGNYLFYFFSFSYVLVHQVAKISNFKIYFISVDVYFHFKFFFMVHGFMVMVTVGAILVQ